MHLSGAGMAQVWRVLWLVCGLAGLCGVALAQQSAPAAGAPALVAEVPVVVFNRTVTVLRGAFLGVGPEDRARRIAATIREELARSGPGKVSVEIIPQGRMVSIDGRLGFILVQGDVDPLKQDSLDDTAAHAAKMLDKVVRETREARNWSALVHAAGIVALATLILGGLLWICFRIRNALSIRLVRLAESSAQRLRLGGEHLIHGERLLDMVRWSLRLALLCIALLLFYEWLSFSLAQFPYTRPWGEQLNQLLVDALVGLLGGVAGAIPNLVVAILVFLAARWLIRVLGAFFDRVETRKTAFSWLDPHTVAPTRRLTAVAIWLFALAMAYPYLPGAQTEAFKGLSVLVGLMVSLGASSLVGQGASGLILIYSRTLQVGEYVRIGESEGSIVAIGMFSTRIRTGLGEEITLSNSQILNSVTKNYSRTVQGAGYIVDTSVTIGYDTP